MPPDGGRASMAPVVGPLRSADLAFGEPRGDALGSCPTPSAAARPTASRSRRRRRWRVLMTAAGFDVMNLANNHADDFGAAGERSTERALRGRRAALDGAAGPDHDHAPQRAAHRVARLRALQVGLAARADRASPRRSCAERPREADLVVVAMHAGAEGSGATHVPHGTETFLGENRGDSRRFAHAVIDAGADLVVGSGPHVIRGVERYHGRLIAYSTGNFAGYKNFGTGGTLSLSAILSVRAARRRRLRRRHLDRRCALDGNALPHLDPSDASARLVAQLSREDFGVVGGAHRRGRRRSGCDVGSGPCHLSRRRRRGPSRNRAFRWPGSLGRRQEGCARRARLEGQPERRRPRRAAAASAWRPGASGRCCSGCSSSTTGSPRRSRTSPSARASPTRRSSSTRCKSEQRQRGHDHRAERRGRVQASRSRSTRRRFTRFATNQPALPTDDTLLAPAQGRARSRSTPSRPTPGAACSQQILLGFGPTLLILGIIIFAMRRATAGGGALGSLGRSKAQALRGHRAGHVRGRRRHRGGRAGARRGRRLPQEPGEVRRAGRQDPARRAALGPARHRQDAARARGRRRGRRAVLLGQRERVRRDDRGRRRLARARPLRAGQGRAAGHRLHRRARRDRPRARRRREPRRPRRARADAQPDPHRDGRLQPEQRRDRAGGDQPAGRARQGAAAARALRPPRVRAAARPAGPARDPAGAHALGAALARGRSRLDRLDDARHGRRRPREPRQRGRAPGRPPRATRASRWPTSPTPSRRSCWASSGA